MSGSVSLQRKLVESNAHCVTLVLLPLFLSLTVCEMRRFMATDEFKSNPNGFPLDPDRLAAAAQASGNLSELIWER